MQPITLMPVHISRRQRSAWLALQKFVLQHTYLDSYADFRFRIEDANKTPQEFVELCERCGLSQRRRRGAGNTLGCPTAQQFANFAAGIGTSVNHGHVRRRVVIKLTQAGSRSQLGNRFMTAL